MIKCDLCGTLYTKEEYEKLEQTGHNIVWDFDYRKCGECGAAITPLKANIHGKIGGN